MKIGSVSNNITVNPNTSRQLVDSAKPDGQVYDDQIDTSQAPTPVPQKIKGPEDKEDPTDPEIIAKSVEQANKTLKMYDRTIELSIHEVTKTVMYKLKDTKTNEVIMEFPPKKIQDMIAKMWELAGLFVDEKA